MKTSDFHRLLADMCAQLGLGKGKGLQNAIQLRVGGHDMLLQHDESHHPNALQARVDLGPVPENKREWGWFRLLTSNHRWGANGVVGWSLAPQGNHVTMTVLHPFDPFTTAAEVVLWLHTLEAAAQLHWELLLSESGMPDIALLTSLACPSRPFSAENTAPWVEAVDALCASLNTMQRDALLADGFAFEMGGMPMLLRHDAAVPGQFQVHVNLGLEIAGTREQLWQGLLWNNFLMGTGGRMLFSAHPMKDLILLTFQQDIPLSPDGDDFVTLLRSLAEHARNFWADARQTVARIQSIERRKGNWSN